MTSTSDGRSVVKRQQAGVIGPPSDGRIAGDPGGRALNDSAWSDPVLSFADLGLDIDEGSALASSVRTEAGVRRRPDATYYRLRIGWAGYDSGLLVARAVQSLVRGRDGRLRTDGPYAISSVDNFRPVSGPRHRIGDVKVDTATAGGSESGAEAAQQDQLQKQFQSAFSALAFLPLSVRRSVLARIAGATVFSGQAVQYDNGDRHVVSLAGIYATGAIVVRAGTHRDTRNWAVDQWIYDWPPAQNARLTGPEQARLLLSP